MIDMIMKWLYQNSAAIIISSLISLITEREIEMNC